MSAALPIVTPAVASPYSDLKAAWHMDKIAALRRGERIVPAQVQLILSDLCNQDCSFCSYRMSNGFSSEQFADEQGNRNPKRFIPYAKAIEILDDCAALGVPAIQFTGGGEPTVHPQHMDVFWHALHLGLECALVTNGVLLRPGWEGTLPRFKWIRVSLDAGTPKTYAAVRRTKPESFDRALTHIHQLAASIEHGGSDCLLGVGYVVTPDNWHEIAKATAAIAATGAANVRISAMFSKDFMAPFAALHEGIRTEIEMAKTLESPTFKVVDLFGDRIADMEQHAPDYSFCGYQEFNVYIGGNLKVYRCCNTAYTAHGEVGDLSSTTFAEWFAASTPRYKSFNARSCSVCQFNSKNRTINYMVDPGPLHANFV